ncbi:Plexin-B [Nymphon striatum]|nr:Plexin-B [Nymphon striatum]
MCPACTNVWARDLGNYRNPVEMFKCNELKRFYGPINTVEGHLKTHELKNFQINNHMFLDGEHSTKVLMSINQNPYYAFQRSSKLTYFVDLTIRKLPQLPYGAKYLCVFGKSAPIEAKPTRSGLSCVTPVLPVRPNIPEGKDHVYVELAVRSSETRTNFVHRPFAFYDCSVHTMCKSCVTSNWPCNWCMFENKCTHNISSCTKTIVGENNPAESLVKGRSFCPSFDIKDEILVPNGVRKEITIDVLHLPSPERIQCLVEMEGAKELINAKVKNNKVICAETMYSYHTAVGRLQAKLTVFWNRNYHIDTTNTTTEDQTVVCVKRSPENIYVPGVKGAAIIANNVWI